MRKYSLIPHEIFFQGEKIQKIMICEMSTSVFVFLYNTLEDGFSYHQQSFSSIAEAKSYYQQLGIHSLDWHSIPDCLEYCNLDWIAPVRLKGRNIGTPNLEGIYEQFDGSHWIEIFPFKEDDK